MIFDGWLQKAGSFSRLMFDRDADLRSHIEDNCGLDFEYNIGTFSDRKFSSGTYKPNIYGRGCYENMNGKFLLIIENELELNNFIRDNVGRRFRMDIKPYIRQIRLDVDGDIKIY